MCAKNSKKQVSAKRVILWVVLVLLILILAAALLIWWALKYSEDLEPDVVEQESSAAVESEDTAVNTPMAEVLENVDATLTEGLQVTQIGAYTGAFVEDGSNDVVSGVLMLVVKNTGESAIEYAQLELPTDGGTAQFSISTLPVGASAVLLEQNRMAYTGREDVSKLASPVVALFDAPLSLQADRLQIQVLDGAINVTNISGEDITGDIIIYYKNAAADIYYGGITYRVRIEGGMDSGEIQQIMASHFSENGSQIMFVTIG